MAVRMQEGSTRAPQGPDAASPAPFRQREQARVRAHLEGAWTMVDGVQTSSLPPKTATRRQALLAHLRAYIDAEQFPINEVTDEPTPIFVDDHGNLCAVAALLDATGRRDLVEHVASSHNFARVHQLVSEPQFAAWLDFHGLTTAEAARIQPAYHAHLEADWQPTASIISSAQVGTTEEVGTESSVAIGVRAGIRRSVHGSDDRGYSQHGSIALAAEYARGAVIERGATNYLGLLLQWELIGNSDDAQFYLLGGPLASVDDDDRPGSGFGGQLGAGFSFRRRDLPVLFEVVAQSLDQGGYVTARVGAQLGMVW